MATPTLVGGILGTPGTKARRILTGDQPKLLTLWLVLSGKEVAGA